MTSLITAILMAVSVLLGNIGHTEYKSQVRKRKANASVINTQICEAEVCQIGYCDKCGAKLPSTSVENTSIESETE